MTCLQQLQCQKVCGILVCDASKTDPETVSAAPNWPPRSPHDVLLSSPNGRKKLSQCQDRTSPSPSPLKRSGTTPNLQHRARQLAEATLGQDDEEEDEETLQLQLQAIEAKLKLKKLQARSKTIASNSCIHRNGPAHSQPPARAGSVLSSRANRQRAEGEDIVLVRSKSQAEIQIPLSPPQKRIVTEEPRSPGRVLLGIDKGLKGRDVSLRRAPSLREDSNRHQDPFGGCLQQQSSRSSNQGSMRTRNAPAIESQARPKSFSERIAEIRANDKDEKKRADEIRKKRSKGFGVDEKELDDFKKNADIHTAKPALRESNNRQSEERGFSREEVLKAFNKPISGLLHRNNTVSGVRNTQRIDIPFTTVSNSTKETSKQHTAAYEISRPSSAATTTRRPSSPPVKPRTETPPSSPQPDSTLFECFSSLHLSKRILPHTFLTRTFADKQTFLIHDLLRTIKAPDYQTPDTEQDFVVFGIVASKSAPRDHKETHKTSTSKDADPDNGRSKYMVITLTDLKWELQLYLFTTAFTRFWKLTPGTLVAILNPGVMPPRPSDVDTGRFSLVLNSSDDTVLEIGTARDLGFCKSIKRDGKVCDAWVDKRHTEFCSFHVDKQVAKMKAGRMEVNTMSAPFAPGGRSGSRTGLFGSGRSRRGGDKANVKDDGLRKEGAQYDRFSSTRYFIAPSVSGSGRSAADLLDDEDVDPDAFHRGTNKEERLRRRLAEREKEREIARILGEGGNGIGQEYLRIGNSGTSKQCNDDDPNGRGAPDPLDAGSLGLLGNKAEAVSLSPMKRKRSVIGQNSETVRKKTRFVTAKGIREAGRESIGVVNVTSDGDDGLDIV